MSKPKPTGPAPKIRPRGETIKKLVLEVATIVLGISLALLANAWYEGLKSKKQVRDVLSAIRQELLENRKEIEAGLPVQRRVHQFLNTYAITPEKTLSGVFTDINRQGESIRIPRLHLASWDSALSTGIAKSMDFETVRMLSDIQHSHQLSDIRLRRMLDIVYSPDSFDPTHTQALVLTTRLLLSDALYNQERLMKLYDQVLAKMGGSGIGKAAGTN